MSDLSTEIESFSAKRSSLRDKLKKRREAIGSILSQTTGAAASALSDDTKQATKLPSPPPPVKPELRKPTPDAEKLSPGETTNHDKPFWPLESSIKPQSESVRWYYFLFQCLRKSTMKESVIPHKHQRLDITLRVGREGPAMPGPTRVELTI